MKELSVVLLGAGNVAAFFLHNMLKHGIRVERIIARDAEKVQALAAGTGTAWSTDFSELGDEGNIIVSAVKDSAARELWSRCDFGGRLVLHTAGTLPIDALKPFAPDCGVLYPLQTISARRVIDSRNVPLLIEANDEKNLARLKILAEALSENVREVNSDSRKKLHLAAVFANNFSNLCFHIAWEMLEQQQLDPEILLPLIDETCAKLHTIPPALAQTGPAVRWDENVMNFHLDMLKDDPELAELYRVLSAAIHRR